MAASRLIARLLFEVHPSDPRTLGIVSGALIVVALMACWIPATRAARIDPLVSLRDE